MRSPDHTCPIVCLTDVTDPEAVRDHTCVRTLSDDEGNRYVLLTTAQYLRLLQPGGGCTSTRGIEQQGTRQNDTTKSER